MLNDALNPFVRLKPISHTISLYASGRRRLCSPLILKRVLAHTTRQSKFLEQLQLPLNDYTINRQPPQPWVRSLRIMCAYTCLVSLQQCLRCRKIRSHAAEISTVCEAICVARLNSDACKWTSSISMTVLESMDYEVLYGDIEFCAAVCVARPNAKSMADQRLTEDFYRYRS